MKTKILVVDDEADLELLIKQKFRRKIRESTYEFLFATNGQEALERILENPDTDVILSDINMPGKSGLDLLGHVKTEFEMPPTTMMMITAYGDDASYQQAMSLGANDFLTKPVDFAVLKEKLQHLLP